MTIRDSDSPLPLCQLIEGSLRKPKRGRVIRGFKKKVKEKERRRRHCVAREEKQR